MLAYEITGVVDSQEDNPRTDNVVNTYEVTFTVPEKEYTSTVIVPKTGTDVVGAIKSAVEKAVAEVEQIYALSTASAPAA